MGYLNSTFGLGVLYILISLAIGECHPFSRVEMYNSFPNRAESIALLNSDNKVIPIQQYFNYSSEHLTHNYNNLVEYSIATNNKDKPILGSQLWNQLTKYQKTELPKGKINLCLQTQYFKGKSLQKALIILHEESID